MKEHLNGNTTFSTLLMLTPGGTKLVLVVEGADDALILRDHLGEGVQLLVAVGRRNSLEAARLVDQEGLRGVRFIIDRDLDGLYGLPAFYPSCVIATVEPDLISEVLAVRPDLLHRVLSVHARTKLRSSPRLTVEQIVEEGRTLSRRLMPVRATSQKHQASIRFRDFPFDTVIARGGSEAGHHLIAQVALDRSNSQIAYEEFVQLLEDVIPLEDVGLLAPGDHDLLRAIAAVMRLHGVQGVSVEVLVGAIVLVVDCDVIVSLPAVSKFQEWAATLGVDALTCASTKAA